MLAFNFTTYTEARTGFVSLIGGAISVWTSGNEMRGKLGEGGSIDTSGVSRIVHVLQTIDGQTPYHSTLRNLKH